MLDLVVPLEPAGRMLQKLFMAVKQDVVADDHYSHETVHELDWISILE